MTDQRPRYLVTGATGMVGRSLVEALRARGNAVAGSSRGRKIVAEAPHFVWDVADEVPPAELLDWGPQFVVHAAALTDVDYCETNPQDAMRVNGAGSAHVARLARAWGARLVYLSTDSVFDGRRGLYQDYEPPHPLNVYAESKARGERESLEVAGSLVVRFNVIGPERLTFWILSSVARGEPIEVFEDARFNPIETRDLAHLIADLSLAPIEGVCHLASDEVVSKAEYAERLVAYAGLEGRARVMRARLADKPMMAARPLDTSLRPSARVQALVAMPRLDPAIRRLALDFAYQHG